MGRRLRGRLGDVLAAFGAAFVALLLSLSPLGFALEEETGLRWLFGLRGAREPPETVAVVRLDRATLSGLRALPSDPAAWPEPLRGCVARYPGLAALRQVYALDRLPRETYACAVDELTRRGVPVIAFDIGFADIPDREPGTAELAAAIRAHGGVVLLEMAERRPLDGSAATVDTRVPPHPLLTAEAAGTAAFVLPRGVSTVHQFWSRHDGDLQLPARALEVLALPALDRWADSAGLVPPGGSAASRRARLVEAWLAVAEAPPATLAEGDRLLLEALRRVETGPAQHHLDFFGPPGTVPSISLLGLLSGAAGPDLAGRTVFVGAQEPTLLDGRDHFPTVFRNSLGVDLAGVEIAATAFDNLLRDQTLRGLPEAARLLLVAGLAVAMAAAATRGTVWRGIAGVLGLATAYALVVWTAFVEARLWLPVAVPLCMLVLALLLGPLMHYLGAVRLFGIFVPRPVTRRALRGELAAERPIRGEVTIMFTDIVGFSTLVEPQQPEAVKDFLDRHYTLIVDEIERQGGLVAQFVGDSVLAFWGTPDPVPDHAARAAWAALAIGAALEHDNRRRILAGEPPIRLRIGINTGTISAGRVGAEGRATYAVVGDPVNTTQRIEQLGKVLCPDQPTAAILLGEATARMLAGRFELEPVGRHPLRGRSRIEGIFRLRADLRAATAGQRFARLSIAE
ncbi:MAG TPA: adenylate/guanylate cyclase domain-containing protein [Geminicoccaceae bacterium]|nr:adenylate/guanylate cyclase domain-containing protein [Geminicoccus sp.]HMU52819.1 adenylate/guanylate cyclase domain-containing protein [Geminicoccaceae bacterium]